MITLLNNINKLTYLQCIARLKVLNALLSNERNLSSADKTLIQLEKKALILQELATMPKSVNVFTQAVNYSSKLV